MSWLLTFAPEEHLQVLVSAVYQSHRSWHQFPPVAPAFGSSIWISSKTYPAPGDPALSTKWKESDNLLCFMKTHDEGQRWLKTLAIRPRCHQALLCERSVLHLHIWIQPKQSTYKQHVKQESINGNVQETSVCNTLRLLQKKTLDTKP